MPPEYQSPSIQSDPKPPTVPGSSSRSYLGLLLAISAAVILIDRLTKLFIIHHVPSDAARTIIPGVLRITHVLNTGAAFSMFAESASPATVRIALIVFSLERSAPPPSPSPSSSAEPSATSTTASATTTSSTSSKSTSSTTTGPTST